MISNNTQAAFIRMVLLAGLLLSAVLPWPVQAQQPSGAMSAAALNTLRSAAERGEVRAQVILGKAYLLGERLAVDDDKGVYWLRQAARGSDRVAQAWLGWAYEQGRGVRKDPQRAFSWYSRSARQGYDWAAQQRDRLEASGSPMAGDLDQRRREQEQPLVTRRAAQPDAPTPRSQSDVQYQPELAVEPDGRSAPIDISRSGFTATGADTDPEQIVEQLRAWVIAEVTSQIPAQVQADEPTTVVLQLPSPPQLLQWQATGIGIRVQADLQVDGSVVEPVSKPEQALRPRQGASWRWQITALESGKPLFDLALRARVLVPDHEALRVELLRLGPRVAVELSWSQRAWKLLRENQVAIGLTVLVPLFLWLGMSFAGRRRPG